jgi:hypothetical protein
MNDERRIRIVWPEARYVPESQIRLWFSDAITNGEIKAHVISASESLEEICRELEHAALITLHREWKEDL